MTPLEGARRLVVKIGSSILVDETRGEIRRDWLETLTDDVARLHKGGCEVVLVSSGAIRLGRTHFKLAPGPLKLEESQAAAATGQIQLAHAYQEALARHGITVAQVLLTLDDSEERRRYLNARQTMATLLAMKAVPVINENDTVATDEIRFGDNDRLSARVAEMISADTLVLLSDIDGLYTGDPRIDASAKFIPEIREITPAIEAMGGSAASELSNGGMATKLMAGRIAMAAGCRMAIADGRAVGALGALIDGKARCSWFLPEGSPLSARKKWIKGSLKTAGALTVDDGAVRALSAGKSLLPAGVTVHRGRVQARRRGRREGPRRPRAGARPGGLCRRRRPPHRRPQERGDRAAAGFPRSRRDRPSRRPRGRVSAGRAILERPMNVQTKPAEDAAAIVAELGRRAREAAVALRNASTDAKNRALAEAARLIRGEKAAILAANARDIDAAKAAGMSAALQDRLLLDEARVEAMAKGLDDIVALPDPVGARIERMDAAQRPGDQPRAGADRHHRRDLRGPAQRHRRCRRALHQVGQCRGAARRLRQLPLLARHRRAAAPRAYGRRPARGLRAARAHHRSRGGGRAVARDRPGSTSSCRAAGAR